MAHRMLEWSEAGGTGGVFALTGSGGISASVAQAGRKHDGSKRFWADQALDTNWPAVRSPRLSLEEAKDDAEESVYLRAVELLPRLQAYVELYEQRNPAAVTARSRSKK